MICRISASDGVARDAKHQISSSLFLLICLLLVIIYDRAGKRIPKAAGAVEFIFN